MMNKAANVVGAAGVGAALMYFFDPVRGKRRRAKVLDKATRLKRTVSDAAGKTQRDAHNRIVGVIAETEALFRCEKVSDGVLEARVRSKLGRVVSHPHAVKVKVVDGLITLSGPILAHEVLPLCEAVISINGVQNIENLLEIHENGTDVPALQNEKGGFREHSGPIKSTWSPTARLIAGLTGGALTIYGGKRRGVVGTLMSTIGLSVVTGALTNMKAAELVGINADIKASPQTTSIDTPATT
jgi:hypothetical protein